MSRRFVLVGTLLFCVLANVFIVSQQKPRRIERPQIHQPQIQNPQPPTPVKPPAVTPDSARDSITADELQKHVVYLSSKELAGRHSGTPECDKAGEYITDYFKKAGLPTKAQPFRLGGATTSNVYAWIDGSGGSKDQVIIVGGHYDHIGRDASLSRDHKTDIHPGADDNASGTSVVLELAKAFATIKGQNKRTIVFQCYSGEEEGLKGSQFYCDNPCFPVDKPSIKKHIFMLNFDMVGYSHEKCLFPMKSVFDVPQVNDLISRLSSKYPFAKEVSGKGGGGSDHVSFSRRGVPALFIHTGLHQNYHTVNDTPEKLNYKGMERIARYGFDLLWLVDQSEDTPKMEWNVKSEPQDRFDHNVPDSPFPQ